MLKSLSAYIKKHGLLHPGDRLGLAVSGGADSVALLRAMLELRAELGVVLSVVHFHHGIRGIEADADESFVAQLARQHNLPFCCDRADVPEFARAQHLGLEAAARHLRYKFFDHLVARQEMNKIATAHTRDDQAETVLLRFLRGAGTRGLAGIHPVRAIIGGKVIRPMLDVSRGDVLTYLGSLDQDWREDATNSDTTLTRNRIRHELLPLLERGYNPNLRQNLSEYADVCRDEELFWAELLSNLPDEAFHQFAGKTRIRLGLPSTRSTAVRRRLIRIWSDLTGVQLDQHHVEQLLTLATHKQAGVVHLPHGWIAHRTGTPEDPTLVIEPANNAPEPAGYDYPLSIPSEVYISPISTQVRITFVRYTTDVGLYNPASLLDASLLREPLRLRNWRHGDRFRPLHRGSEEKLKRLFQEKHIPAEQRGFWPVVTSGDRLVWAKDFPVAAEFAAREGTTEAVLIEAVGL